MAAEPATPIPTTIERLARERGPAVVGLRRGARGGSGVVVAPGRVATLARNLRGAEVAVAFAGREAPGRLLGTDPDLGVAVLDVETGEAIPPPWGDGDGALGIGAPVYALADPAGRGLRVTAGHVSCAPGRMRGARGRAIEGVIEHTAPLPRGAGGGPLLDAGGRLVGLNALRRDGGMILALPADAVRRAVEAIAAGTVAHPRRLGVALAPPRASRRLREAVGLEPRTGLLVRAVEEGSAAATAGVARGDLIVAAGERPVAELDDLHRALDAAADRPLTLALVRGSEELTVTVEAGEQERT